MKKALAIGLALVTLVSFTPNAHSVGIFASWWNSEDLDNGFGLGANRQFQIVPMVGADVRASWVRFDVNGVSVNALPLEASAYAKLGLYYGGLGVGYYILDNDLDSLFGGFIYAGASIAVADLGIFGELKYTKGESGSGVVDVSGIGLNVGVVLPFF